MATQQRAPCLGSGERSAAAGVQREQRGMSLLGAHSTQTLPRPSSSPQCIRICLRVHLSHLTGSLAQYL